MSEIKIMPMQACHVQQVAELEAQCFSAPWSEASVASELTNPLSLWLVACSGQTVVGYVGSQSVLDEADMMNLAVSPEYRRQHIAASLLQALEHELQVRGVGSLCLEVRQSNEPAKALYLAHGYVQIGCRPGYYQKPREDALILKKQWSVAT